MTVPRTCALALACAAFAAGCRGEMNATVTDKPGILFEQITSAQWEGLAAQRIFFAHQSVGDNLLDGVRDLMRQNAGIRLNLVQISGPREVNGPAFYHSLVGRNGEPSSKLDEFSKTVSGVGDSGIALLKYCYVDVQHGTDAQALFDEYRRKVASIARQYPRLTVVHVTLPLVTDAGTLRHLAAVARRKAPAREVNLIRHQYNELLRSTYVGKEPVFDLARLESTNADGTTETVRYQGQRVPVLATAWTSDGGHLNEAGRQRMAKALLTTLVGVSSRTY
jgi:hypothetical protein